MDFTKQNHKHNRRRRRSMQTKHRCSRAGASDGLDLVRLCPLLFVYVTSCCVLWLSTQPVCHAQSFLPTATTLQSQSPSQSGYLLPGFNMENLRISELKPIGSVVYQLKADARLPSESTRKISYALTGDTFSVDEDTGEVRLMKQLDRERQPIISTVVNVLASDLEQPLESRRRTILVEDADDSWPVFAPSHKFALVNNAQLGQYVYQAEVSEQAPVGSIVIGEILVTDADEGANAEIVFECRARHSSAGACDSFALESRRLNQGRYSVSVRTKAPLDYERQRHHKLSLLARGRRPSPLKGTPLEAEAVININVANIQDEGPVFLNAPYALSMREGLRPGTSLLELVVQDGDAAPQRELSIRVVDGPFSSFFQVTKDPELSRVWYLETKQTLDRESAPVNQAAGNMFTIDLLAAELDESGKPVASDLELLAAVQNSSANYPRTLLRREQITILVLDLPDSKPLFVHVNSNKPVVENPLVVNVSESSAEGAALANLNLAVQDLDQGINSRFNLSLVDAEVGPAASRALALETRTVHGRAEVVLRVLNASLLDYEEPSLRQYRFALQASKWGPTSGGDGDEQPSLIVQKLEIQLNVLDANDNWPEFERDQFVVSVPEGSLPGHLVATIRARDRDSGSNGRVDYMLRGKGASNFKLVSSEGKILVNDCALAQCLDYETQPSYSLSYEARDGGGHMRNVSVLVNVIDANDHAPKFSESVYKRELISDNLSSKQNYISPQLIVRARDGDGPTQGRNNITYRIVSSNLTGLDVEPSSGLVYIMQPLDLDALQQSGTERKMVFEAQVVAEDNGSPPLNSSATILLSLKGNRDGAPQFKQDSYSAYVREDQPVGQPFFQVQAVDPDDRDSQLRYSLGHDPNDLLQIDAQSGKLSLKSELDFDSFKGEPYNVTVHATDNARPYPLRASAQVSIHLQDVNNKRPQFEHAEYRATLVQAKTRPGEQILRVTALDPDKSHQLNYSILLDSLTLIDRNGQQFSLGDIENASRGYLDQMSRPERAQLVLGLKRMFSVNRRTGSVQLDSEPDYSLAASISFQVQVVDLNQEVFNKSGQLQQDLCQCTVFLQTHVDKSPIFAPPWSIARRDYNLTILEELPVESQIFSLLAKDPQTNQRIEHFEKVHDSDPRDFFRVDRSGLIVVQRRIDFEELPAPKRLTLSVRAVTSEALFSVANLNIQVTDVNDNAPQFRNHSYQVAVSEALQPGDDIMTLAADDRDSERFGQVFYSLSGYQSELFQIHPRKGSLSLRRGAKLDRDIEASYYLMATASDCNDTQATSREASVMPLGVAHDGQQASGSSCKKSSVPLEIVVTDENDNDPVFVRLNKRGEYEAVVSETVAVGSVIVQVQAHDPDEGPNGQVGYEIVRSDDALSGLFKVDAEGYISAQASLAGLGRRSPHRISVRAYDHGPKVVRQAYATLLLTIQDVVSNDGVPRFIQPKQDEVVTLSESAGPNSFVYQVQAVDPDEEANGKLMYKFVQPSDTFDIDPFEGVIKTQHRANFYLDREQIPNYTLIVVAQDFGQPPKQAHQILNIIITDVNDNEPYFEREFDDPPLVLYIDEEVPKDTLIGQVQAIDKDGGQNALIGYEIIEGNQNNLFRLNWDAEEGSRQHQGGNNACKIYSNGRLDREAKESHLLTIRASSMSRVRNHLIPAHLRDPLGSRNPFNQYNATDLTKIRLLIKLNDVNDNRPVFSEQNPKSIVDSSAEIYSQLLVIKAQDADSSSAPIQYSILDALYFSDSKLNIISKSHQASVGQNHDDAISMRHVFDIDQRSGIVRNSHSLRPYTDGYFEVFIKADSGRYESDASRQLESRLPISELADDKCPSDGHASNHPNNSSAFLLGSDIKENCFVAVTKAVVFVTHQRETIRFVFNKTKLNDRLDEFKEKVQQALGDMMFEPAQAQASYGGPEGSLQRGDPSKTERVFLNTFQTDFYEREDGSLDFSTITSCSQLVKFDDRHNNNGAKSGLSLGAYGYESQIVPNQVVDFEEVISLLKALNATQVRQQQQQQQQSQQQQTSYIKPSLFSQYGLVKIERCLPDKTTYKMTLPERVALYFAAFIALVSILLAFIVSRMRRRYEKNLRIHQRSKYHYGMATPASPFGA